MALLSFLRPFDIRSLPDIAPTEPRPGLLLLDDGETRLEIFGPDAPAYRPKVAVMAPLTTGTITHDGALVAKIDATGLPASFLAEARGAGLARAMLAGDDVIRGSAGADRLLGFAGDDTLTGGGGRDVMTGGGGADVFRFTALADSPAGAADRITDFHAGRDTLDLRAIDALAGDGSGAAEQSAGSGLSGAAADWHFAGRVLEADIDGDGLADFALRFSKGHLPDAGDILL